MTSPLDPGSARLAVASTLVAAALLASTQAEARVTRLTIVGKESPTYGGQSFGTAGQYERIIGTAARRAR